MTKQVPKAWRINESNKTSKLSAMNIIFIHQNPSSLGVTGKGCLSGTPGSSGTKPELINSSGFSLLGTIGFSLLGTMGTIAIKSILSTNKLQVVKEINYPSQRYRFRAKQLKEVTDCSPGRLVSHRGPSSIKNPMKWMPWSRLEEIQG